jgi:hypothetical protein
MCTVCSRAQVLFLFSPEKLQPVRLELRLFLKLLAKRRGLAFTEARQFWEGRNKEPRMDADELHGSSEQLRQSGPRQDCGIQIAASQDARI